MEAQALKAALEWYIDNGVDEAIMDEPLDRFAVAKTLNEKPVAEALRQETVGGQSVRPSYDKSMAAGAAQPLGASDARYEALKAAQAAGTLEELKAAIEAFEGLGLKKTASNMVFAAGNVQAPLMYIGDAPGADDDRGGIPFDGAQGRFLDVMFNAIDMRRDAEDSSKSLYLTNILNWRPPGGRTPAPGEIEVALPFIERHIQLVKPKILVFSGGLAAKALLGRSEGLSKLRKGWHEYLPQTEAYQGGAQPIPAIVTFPPSYLLKTPAQKRGAWADLLSIKERLSAL
ncbi:MAG: uracil-DNA glycosylase [Micavibrio sp.]|nr:uracil-DNA glycosylase [Micavibrio sp.]|tara:strand:- start:15170 stop:16030 length:861 start_codon:yes stop_codon:yes gene_type:complete